MELLKNILQLKKKLKKQRAIQYWQEIALKIIEFTKASSKYHSSIFKTCKQDLMAAQRSFTACKELNKPFIKYYFKVFNEYGNSRQQINVMGSNPGISKRQNNKTRIRHNT